MPIKLWHSQNDDYKAFHLAKIIAATAANEKNKQMKEITDNKLDINRGVNKPIEFKGLKAQYIGYLCGGLLILLLLFAILYIIGVSLYLLSVVIGIAGFVLFSFVFKFSHKYGPYGLMKKAAYGRLPKSLKGTRLYKTLK